MFYYWLVYLKHLEKNPSTLFELDCAHYLFNLKLISDIEKYQFIESTLRGDISVIRKFLTYYDANKPSNIIYLDANNL